MEKFGNAQTVTTQRKTKKEKRLLITGLVPVVRSLCTFIDLCIHINANTRFQFDGDAIIPDDDLFEPASHQRFVEVVEVGSLVSDIILQVVDSLDLFVSCGSVYGGLLAEFLKSEYFIGNFVIVFFWSLRNISPCSPQMTIWEKQ